MPTPADERRLAAGIPLQGVLRSDGRPVKKAAALTLTMLRQILATCDQSSHWRKAPGCRFKKISTGD
jgi:hypothetical protein